MEKEREWGKDMFGGSGNGNRKGCGGYVEWGYCLGWRDGNGGEGGGNRKIAYKESKKEFETFNILGKK